MSTCPSPETLGRVALGSPGDARFAAMEAHVLDCAECQRAVERLAAGTPASGARRLPAPGRPPEIPGFEIERELGRGGMAVVYQAWQPRLARRVAIKVVSGDVGIDADDRRRWLREARAIGRVRHRNVVRLHEAGEHDGCLYLVLDLIAGGSLAARARGPLPPRIAAALVEQVARAVDELHRAGMLHLDIKPSNILLDGPADGPWDRVTPMVADFGIARTGNDPGATASGRLGVRGTPSFMAPEQVEGDRAAVGPRSDVHGLGATLYHLLTGRPPFQAASAIEVIDLVRTREPAPPSALVPGLPADLETIALACLRKDPQRRYASAAELADDLRRWLDGFPIRERPASLLERAGRWCRRRPALASALAALAVTVASSLAGLLILLRHAESQRSLAEAALARAVASDRATSTSVRDVFRLLLTNPHILSVERDIESSRVVRGVTAELRRNPEIARASLGVICEVECRLAEHLWLRGNGAEAGIVLVDALDLLEDRARDADDPECDAARAHALTILAEFARGAGRLDEAVGLYRRAGEALDRVPGAALNLRVIAWLDASRRMIARRFGASGREEARRALLESHAGMLDRLGGRPGADPSIGALAAIVRSELHGDDAAAARVVEAIRRMPGGRPPQAVQAIISGWIAADLRPSLSDPYPPGEPGPRPAPEAHALAVLGALESRFRSLGIAPALLPAAALQIGSDASARAAGHRHAGRLDEARRTVACLAALAGTQAHRSPGDPASHALLSLAYEQESKNAWRVEDRAAVADALRKALAEARTALRLEPEDEEGSLRVAILQDKLLRVELGRSSSR